VGAVASSDIVWLLADLSLGIMTIINLPVLFSMRREIKEETDGFFLKE
jgi:Na+/alanine symporter